MVNRSSEKSVLWQRLYGLDKVFDLLLLNEEMAAQGRYGYQSGAFLRGSYSGFTFFCQRH